MIIVSLSISRICMCAKKDYWSTSIHVVGSFYLVWNAIITMIIVTRDLLCQKIEPGFKKISHSLDFCKIYMQFSLATSSCHELLNAKDAPLKNMIKLERPRVTWSFRKVNFFFVFSYVIYYNTIFSILR